jgi:hypothetical protein
MSWSFDGTTKRLIGHTAYFGAYAGPIDTLLAHISVMISGCSMMVERRSIC